MNEEEAKHQQRVEELKEECESSNTHLDTSKGDFRAPCGAVLIALIVIGIINALFTFPEGFIGQTINMVTFVMVTGIFWVIIQKILETKSK